MSNLKKGVDSKNIQKRKIEGKGNISSEESDCCSYNKSRRPNNIEDVLPTGINISEKGKQIFKCQIKYSDKSNYSTVIIDLQSR